MAVTYVGFVGFLGLVGLRLVQLQVFPRAELQSLAARQLHRSGKIAPYRLPILDRNGEELAISVPAHSVFVRPKLVRSPKKTARILSGIMGGSPEKWLKKLKSPKPFVWLERLVSEDVAKKISKRNLGGVFIEAENRRVYPNGTLAAHVLGFTDIDGNGLAGIELKLNEELLQNINSPTVLRDGRGKPSYVGRKILAEESRKKGIYLTIDRRLQNLLEEELDRSMEESHAQAAMGIILHPVTGEVLAMAQRPTFDPANANKFAPEVLANRMTSHLLEPGSTLKVLFAAQAVDLGLLTKDTLIDCERGKFRVGDKTFTEAHSNGFGSLSLTNVIRYSSNIGALKVAHLLGAGRVAETLEKFHLTTRTGIELSGEVTSGPRPEKYWTPIHLATAGFGQGLSVTPLQVVAAFQPFANGGYWVRPHMLFSEAEAEQVSGTRIVSAKTAETLREILTTVTEVGGTGRRASLPGYKVAGKTGTAQKYDKDLGYQAGKYYSSFVGFLPAEKPELTIGIMVDEPGKDYYASEIAAPVFRRVAERALPLLKRAPVQSTVAYGNFAAVPAPPTSLAKDPEGEALMPNLKGVSLRDALKLLGGHVDRVQVSGTGYLTEQDPPAGEKLPENSPVRLHFSPST